MALFQQENGYVKAGFEPKPIGAMAWAKGDLSTAFREPVHKKPSAEIKQAPRAEKPAVAAENTAKAEAPRVQNSEPQAKAATKQAPQETPAPVKAAIDTPDVPDVARAQAPVAPQEPQTNPLNVAAVDVVADSTAKPTVHDPAKAFRVGLVDDGSEAARVRKYHRDIDKAIDNQYSDDGRKVRNTLMQQAILSQQQQDFMRSQEYATAMALTDQELKKLYKERDELATEIDELKQLQQQQSECVETLESEEAAHVQRDQDLNDLKRQKESHEVDAKAYFAAEAEFNKYEDKVNAIPSMKTIINGDNVYLRSEDGMSLYKIDQDGNTVKVDEMAEFPLSCPAETKTFMRKTADGGIEYVNEHGTVLNQKQTELMNAHLAAQGKKPEDVMGNYDEYKAAVEDPARVAAQDKLIAAGEKAGESQVKLWKEADRLGMSADQLDRIDIEIEKNKKSLEEKRIELEKARADVSVTKEQLALKEADFKDLEEEIRLTEQFKVDMANGKFKTTAEMVQAMPPSIKADYELCMSGKDPSAEASAQCLAPVMGKDVTIDDIKTSLSGNSPSTSADNTSRANGSATDSGIKVSADVGSQFDAASKGTTPANTDTPTPDGPAMTPPRQNLVAAQSMNGP